jgi:prolyl-tRNA synthetase
MTHGDDDGLRVPPALAPFQIVILPMLRDNDGDAALLEYCEGLRAQLASSRALGEPIRVLLDRKPGKAAQKRWDWVRKGVPLILEIGPRDAEAGQVSVLRRDRLWRADAKPDFTAMPRERFAATAASELEDIQRALFADARARRDANIHRGVTSLDEVAAFYADDAKFPGWIELAWAKPDGAELDAIDARLKALKLTIRNTPMEGDPVSGTCPFTGGNAVERIYVARAY